MEDAQHVKVTINGTTGVALVLLDRPKKRNAFSQVMIDDLITALGRLDALDTVRAAVITGGADGPFCGVFPLAPCAKAACSIWLLSSSPPD
jgi:enoyl-CoA hydratase